MYCLAMMDCKAVVCLVLLHLFRANVNAQTCFDPDPGLKGVFNVALEKPVRVIPDTATCGSQNGSATFTSAAFFPSRQGYSELCGPLSSEVGDFCTCPKYGPGELISDECVGRCPRSSSSQQRLIGSRTEVKFAQMHGCSLGDNRFFSPPSGSGDSSASGSGSGQSSDGGGPAMAYQDMEDFWCSKSYRLEHDIGSSTIGFWLQIQDYGAMNLLSFFTPGGNRVNIQVVEAQWRIHLNGQSARDLGTVPLLKSWSHVAIKIEGGNISLTLNASHYNSSVLPAVKPQQPSPQHNILTVGWNCSDIGDTGLQEDPESALCMNNSGRFIVRELTVYDWAMSRREFRETMRHCSNTQYTHLLSLPELSNDRPRNVYGYYTTWQSQPGQEPVTLEIDFTERVAVRSFFLTFREELSLVFTSVTFELGNKSSGHWWHVATIARSCSEMNLKALIVDSATAPVCLNANTTVFRNAVPSQSPESQRRLEPNQYNAAVSLINGRPGVPARADAASFDEVGLDLETREFLVADALRVRFAGFTSSRPREQYYSLSDIKVYAERIQCHCYPEGVLSNYPDCDKDYKCRCRPGAGDPELANNQCRPYITRMIPAYGPVSGGTHTFILGGYLGTTIEITTVVLHIVDPNVTIPLGIIKMNDTMIECQTPNVTEHIEAANLLNTPIPVLVTLGKYQVIAYNLTFTYKPDPIIERIEPRSSILMGGIMQTVYGQHLDSVFLPELSITIVYKHTQTYRQPGVGYCKEKNATQMLCPAPKITLCPPNTACSSLEPVPGRLYKRDVTHRINRRDFEFYLGLKLDGLPDYLNVSDVLAKYGTIDVFVDPEIHDFDESDGIKSFAPHGNTKVIDIKGRRLNHGAHMLDYSISIGENGVCSVVEVLATSIHCRPESTLPTLGLTAKDGAPIVRVTLGYFKDSPGYLRYEFQLCDDPEKCKRIIGGSMAGIAVAILVVVGIVLVRRRNASKSFSPSKSEMDVRYRPKALLDLLEDDVLREDVKTCLIQTDKIQPWPLVKQIGKGQFGTVYQGNYVQDKATCSPVAIKTIKGFSENLKSLAVTEYVKHVEDFLHEAIIMKEYKHENVLSLIGIVVSESSPYVVLPFMENGDLKNFLTNANNNFTVRDLLEFGLDIARGMEYLARRHFVHRDLAARNCMVNKDQAVKIADFGLARDIYEKDYYRVADRGRPLPVKWMAPESLQETKFTAMSDMWSYGVVLWESLTRGKKPYADVDNREMKKHLEMGGRLEQPSAAPDEVYELMTACWQYDPERRPTFANVVSDLESFLGDTGDSGSELEDSKPTSGRGANSSLYENLAHYVDPKVDRHGYEAHADPAAEKTTNRDNPRTSRAPQHQPTVMYKDELQSVLNTKSLQKSSPKPQPRAKPRAMSGKTAQLPKSAATGIKGRSPQTVREPTGYLLPTSQI